MTLMSDHRLRNVAYDGPGYKHMSTSQLNTENMEFYAVEAELENETMV